MVGTQMGENGILTEAEIDAALEALEASFADVDRRDESGRTFRAAHRLTRKTVKPGDDYRVTFGASIPMVKLQRAQEKRRDDYFSWFRSTHCA